MDADAKEILGLALQAESGTESYKTLHAVHLSLAYILIATPVAFSLPSDAIGSLHIVHDRRDAVHIIGLM